MTFLPRVVHGIAVGFTFLAGCSEPALGPALSTAPTQHLWVFHISGGAFANHIQLVMIGDRPDARGRWVFRTLPAMAWDGSRTNDFGAFQVTAADTTGRSWILRSPGGEVLRLSYAVVGDTATGALTLPDGVGYPVFGVRFAPRVARLALPRRPAIELDSTPAIVIRLDDAMLSDRGFLERLSARGLKAEIAVPTRLIGRPNRLTWAELSRWRARGMGVVAHSRYHAGSGADEQAFVAEVVGSLAEMRGAGLPTAIFVQPGSWRDSVYFDTPAKLQTWRGALLRTFTTVSELYVYSGALRSASLSQGLSHVTISDGLSEAAIRAAWQGALRRNRATVFLVHTFRMAAPDQLDWFLDLVSAASARGAVQVLATSDGLFGTARDPAPVEPTEKVARP